jgi:hypothetical protein
MTELKENGHPSASLAPNIRSESAFIKKRETGFVRSRRHG